MRTRIHVWLDTKTLKQKFGVQVLHGKRWMHAHRDGQPLIYGTVKRANKECDRVARETP